MSSLTRKSAAVAAIVLIAALSAKAANNAEQVVFSTPGSVMTLSDGSTTPFGFWIWCNAEAASSSNGGYQLANACQGDMYFYGLQVHAAHVVGQATEGAPGIYTMHVVEGTAAQLFSNTLNPSFTCSLTNVTPDGGDSVTVSCIFIKLGGGTGSATVTGAVVNVTGP